MVGDSRTQESPLFSLLKAGLEEAPMVPGLPERTHTHNGNLQTMAYIKNKPNLRHFERPRPVGP